MSREVFNLLQTQQNEIAEGLSATPLNDPSLQATTLLPTMVPSSRPKGGKVGAMGKNDKVSKWVWAPFSSTARNDGADFHHWVKAGVEYPDYPFARFNVHLDSVEYTEEEVSRTCSLPLTYVYIYIYILSPLLYSNSSSKSLLTHPHSTTCTSPTASGRGATRTC